MWSTFREIQVLKSVNKLCIGPKREKVGQKLLKTIKNVLFSKSGKWHDP
jgi:hypothetical protein